MMRRLANPVLLLVAVAFCYGLQVSKPHYADLIGPFPYAARSETLSSAAASRSR